MEDDYIIAILGLAACRVALSAAGAMPSVGIGRAITLGWRSYLKATTYPVSVRKSECEKLTTELFWQHRGSYVVVCGRPGYGKTCMIDTALHRHHGVVNVTLKSEAGHGAIVDTALRQITGLRQNCWRPEGSAHRVLFLYSFLFKKPPIVVLSVSDRKIGEKYASLTGAVRELTDDYGLRIIVNGSPNSLPPEIFATKRETNLFVGPMSKEQIEYIRELKSLEYFLKEHKLDVPVWKVLGGSPAAYLKLQKEILKNKYPPPEIGFDKIVNQVKNHIELVLVDALCDNVARSTANTRRIIKLFREKKIMQIPLWELNSMGIRLDYPNEVFCEVERDFDHFIEPVSPAVYLIISENIRDRDDIERLCERLFNNTESS